MAEQNVLGDGQLRNEAELLIDRRDAERLRIARRRNRRRPAVEQDLARIFRVRAAEHFHQRRLAGAVLAQEHVHFASAQIEVDAIERDDTRKHLANPAHLEHGRTGEKIDHGRRRYTVFLPKVTELYGATVSH